VGGVTQPDSYSLERSTAILGECAIVGHHLQSYNKQNARIRQRASDDKERRMMCPAYPTVVPRGPSIYPRNRTQFPVSADPIGMIEIT